MAMRLHPDFLAPIKNPGAVQAVLDTTNWSISSLTHYGSNYSHVLPANEDTFYGLNVKGAEAVAGKTTDPHYLDLAARDSRLGVRGALLANPAVTEELAQLVATRASRRSSAQADLVSKAMRMSMTAAEALDLVNDPAFNPASVDRDRNFPRVLTDLILKDPDYLDLMKTATKEGTTSSLYITPHIIAGSSEFQEGAVSALKDALPEGSHLTAPGNLMQYFLAAGTHCPGSVTEDDVREGFLAPIPSYHQKATLKGAALAGLPVKLHQMMWAPDTIPDIALEMMYSSVREYKDLEHRSEIIDLALTFSEALDPERWHAACHDGLRRNPHGYTATPPAAAGLFELKVEGWSSDQIIRAQKLLVQLEDADQENYLSESFQDVRTSFAKLVLHLPDETMGALPPDFLDPIIEHLPCDVLAEDRGYSYGHTYIRKNETPLTRWVDGKAPLKPTAAALVMAFNPLLRSNARHTVDKFCQDLANSLTAADLNAGMLRGETGAWNHQYSVSTLFCHYFGTNPEAWRIGCTMYGDSLEDKTESRMSPPDIALTACALTGIEPAYLTAEPETPKDPETTPDTDDNAEPEGDAETTDPEDTTDLPDPNPEQSPSPEATDEEPAEAPTQEEAPEDTPSEEPTPEDGATEGAAPEVASFLTRSDGQIGFAF